MPLPADLLTEMAAKRAAEAEEAQRHKVRDLALTAVGCVLWAALGITLILWSAHTTEMTYGRAAFYAGIAIGNGGVVFTLLAAYARGERRGDW